MRDSMTMTTETDSTTIRILDREYQIKCGPEKVTELKTSASYLDKKMREISDSGKFLSIDRIAVTAALNITHELLTLENQKKDEVENINLRLQSLLDKVKKALATP